MLSEVLVGSTNGQQHVSRLAVRACVVGLAEDENLRAAPDCKETTGDDQETVDVLVEDDSERDSMKPSQPCS